MSPKAKRYTIAILVSIAAVGSYFAYRGRPEFAPQGERAEQETAQWLERVRQHGKDGYWIAVRGTHPGDQVVAAASAARLTHAVVLDAAHQQVVEAVGPGVRIAQLRNLLAESVRFQIIEPRGFTEERGRTALARARSHVGAPYDWFGTVGVQNNAAYYCSELCADAYNAREEGWMPRVVLHPELLINYGRLLYDSGMRASRYPEIPHRGEL